MEAPQQLFHFFSMEQPNKGQLYEAIITKYQGKTWKYARYYSYGTIHELFNLTSDPIEKQNLYGEAEYNSVQEYLIWILDQIHPNFSS